MTSEKKSPEHGPPLRDEDIIREETIRRIRPVLKGLEQDRLELNNRIYRLRKLLASAGADVTETSPYSRMPTQHAAVMLLLMNGDWVSRGELIQQLLDMGVALKTTHPSMQIAKSLNKCVKHNVLAEREGKIGLPEWK